MGEEAGRMRRHKELRELQAPSIEELRAVGYLETSETYRQVFSWAKQYGRDDVFWPTPTAHVQEALRMDTCGWPSDDTTAEQWLSIIQYWTVLREQLITGAPRRSRN